MPKRKSPIKKSAKDKQAKADAVTKSKRGIKRQKIEESNEGSIIEKGDNIDDNDWLSAESYLIYNPVEVVASEKVAAFDIDGTLIVTKTGKTFPKSWDDFKIMLPEIPDKIKLLKNDGYKLVIFTNQAGFSSGHVTEKDFKRKMMSLLELLGVKIQIFIATDKSLLYRKPNTGLFELLKDKFNSGVQIDLKQSLYVGDAAGRPDNWAPKRKKDFSCSDRLFALNCGVKFYTPEEYFLDEKPAIFDPPKFNPTEALNNPDKLTIKYENLAKTTNSLSDVLPSNASDPVLIIMVGSPGSGKSHFCRHHLEPLGYNVVNRDTLKTWQKCVAMTERLLNEKKKVVIDNTNNDKATRERYISCALKAGVKHLLCFVLDVDQEQSRHNGKFRELTDSEHEKISELVFRVYKSKYQEPQLAEKFTSVCKIVPGLSFDDEDKRRLYRRFLNDK